MEKLLTIAIPAYNMEKYLERCLNSLLIKDEQTQYLEVIIINDGSMDRTIQIAQKFSSRFPNLFKVINKQNGNWGSCINLAAKEATGKYFLILDADDWLETKELESFIEMLKETQDVDLLIYNCTQIRGNERTKIFHTKLTEDRVYKLAEIEKNWDCSFFVHCIALNTPIIKKIHLTEGISYCDVEVVIYMFEYIKNLKIYNKSLYNYIIDRPGQTIEAASYSKNSNAIIKIYRRYNKEHSSNEKILYWQRNSIIPLLNMYYQVNLLYKTSTESFTIFKEIDKEIHKDPILYKSLYAQTFIKVKYIKLWSYLQYRPILRSLVLIQKITNKIKSLF